MKILHIGLCSHYTEGMTYQDNLIAEINAQDGQDVTYISDAFVYEKGLLIETEEMEILLPSSVLLIRLKYDKVINTFISTKIQKVRKLKKYLWNIAPDIILYHGCCGYELITVYKYLKEHKNTILYIDSHEDFNNTAKTPLAKFAYKYLHGYFIKNTLAYARKVFYITAETKIYLKEMYKISDEKLEWFPLGGIIHDIKKREVSRAKLLLELQIPNDSIILGHSGKMISEKKTKELLTAFKSVADKKLKLIIFGIIPEENKTELMKMINSDIRVYYLGWKAEEDIYDLLCSIDLYCQPGTQSATMQMALCCGCPVMLYPYISHRDYMNGNGYYVKTEKDIENVLLEISKYPELLVKMSENSYKLARESLDYHKIAKRIYK